MLARFAVVANIIGFVLVLIFYFNNTEGLEVGEDQENIIGFSLPIAFLIFAILALRFISKDDKLVQSMDRLR